MDLVDLCNALNQHLFLFFRERDSMKQVRMPIEDVAPVVRAMSHDKMSWQQVTEKYPKFEQQETTK